LELLGALPSRFGLLVHSLVCCPIITICWSRRGDAGRDSGLWIGRRLGRYTLPELGKLVVVSYAAVAQAVVKLDLRLAHDPQIKLLADQVATAII
jgi:hypothetical protein